MKLGLGFEEFDGGGHEGEVTWRGDLVGEGDRKV